MTKIVPKDFNGSIYLAINPDVQASKMDPEVHYLAFGIDEGRNYKLEDGAKLITAEARASKMQKLKPFLRLELEHIDRNGKFDFLTDALRAETKIVPTDNVSANGYDGNVINLIQKYPDGLILDCGAGSRTGYFSNVVNYEIVDYESTDILGVGEELPFRDGTFDAVFSIAVLEHVRDPFKCAKEISRVLKPGGDLYFSIPFLQPLHGYPHHYFNATPQGARRLFEDMLDVSEVSVIPSTHPIWSLTWILNLWQQGLPASDKIVFSELKVGDLLKNPTQYLDQNFCRNLPQEVQLQIASATILKAIKPRVS